MSYISTVLGDNPRGLWFLKSGALTDFTTLAGNATKTGAFSATSAAIISNGGKASAVDTTTELKFPSRVYKPGYEHNSFSLEAWVYTTATDSDILSHTGARDGIAVVDGNITFSITFTNSIATITYVPDNQKTIHVVGVYNRDGISLFINGEFYKQLIITEAQQNDSFATSTDQNNLYAGDSDGITYLQGVAIYEYGLRLSQVQNHYRAGRDTVDPDAVPMVYGGEKIDVTDTHANTFLRQFIGPTMSWYLGSLSDVTVNNDGYLVQQYVDGDLKGGTWTYSFNTDYAEDTITGVRLGWEGDGAFIVESSLDGLTWDVVENNNNVPSIVGDVSPSILLVRITFEDGVAGRVFNLELVGFKDNDLDLPNRAVTITDEASLREQWTPVESRFDRGLKLNGGTIIVPPSTAENANGDYTYEFWFYSEEEVDITAHGGTGVTYYQNGESTTLANLSQGSWNLVHVTSTSAMTGLEISGNIIIGRISAYSHKLTTTEISNLYAMYTGKLTITVDDFVDIITVGGDLVQIFSADWVQQAAG